VTGAGIDLFGNQSASDPINSLALVPVSFGTTSEADVPENSGAGTNFVPLSSAPTAFSQVFIDYIFWMALMYIIKCPRIHIQLFMLMWATVTLV